MTLRGIAVGSSPLHAVSVALYRELSTWPGLTSIASVYERLPQGSKTEPPYVVIARVYDDPSVASAMGGNAWDVTAEIGVWSAENKWSEAQAIENQVRQALHGRLPNVAGYHVLECVSLGSDIAEGAFDTPSQEWRGYRCRYRLIVEEEG